MRRAVLFLTTMCVCGLTVNPRCVGAEADAPASIAQRTIALEVFIIDLKSGIQDEQAAAFSGPSAEVAARVQELESEDQIAGMDRVRLMTVENEIAMIQSGTRTPMATGRSSGGRGGGVQTSYAYQNFGTQISAIAKTDGDTVVVALQIEKSQYEQRAGQSQTEGEFPPPGTETLTSEVTLRIDSGQTVLAGRLENRADAKSSGHLVLVSARLLDSPAEASEVTAKDSAKTKLRRIFMLRHAPAEDAARVVKETLDGESSQIRISVDSRTNSLIVSAENEDDLDDVEAILGRLYDSTPQRAAPAPKKEKKSHSAPATSRYDEMAKKDLQNELRRLQEEVLHAQRIAKQAKQEANEAAAAHRSASDNEKADALFRMLEAEIASRKPAEQWKEILLEFDAAKRAYRNLLMTE